jgi:hypothetical protein
LDISTIKKNLPIIHHYSDRVELEAGGFEVGLGYVRMKAAQLGHTIPWRTTSLFLEAWVGSTLARNILPLRVSPHRKKTFINPVPTYYL